MFSRLSFGTKILSWVLPYWPQEEFLTTDYTDFIFLCQFVGDLFFEDVFDGKGDYSLVDRPTPATGAGAKQLFAFGAADKYKYQIQAQCRQ